jgi:hypothetical protein
MSMPHTFLFLYYQMTSKERKDKFASAVGRKEAGIATTLMHLQIWKPIAQFQSRIERQATRSHITTELVTRESRRSKRENVDNRYNNITYYDRLASFLLYIFGANTVKWMLTTSKR